MEHIDRIEWPKIPIIDGSSEPFIELIEQTRIVEPGCSKSLQYRQKIFTITMMKACRDSGPSFDRLPDITLIDFQPFVLGTQHAALKNMKDFKAEIAPPDILLFAWVEMLIDHNLIKGGDINNHNWCCGGQTSY